MIHGVDKNKKQKIAPFVSFLHHDVNMFKFFYGKSLFEIMFDKLKVCLIFKKFV
jgi:hypothetical protein